MKLKTNILFSLLLCGTFATAQNLKLDILPPSVTLGQDSAIVSMKMTLNVPQMDTKSHIRLTPVLTDGTHTAELPQILLNGERAHRLYRRTLALNKRRGKANVTPVFTAIPLTDSDQTIHYRASLPAADWVQFATLNLKKEVINGNGEKVQSENIPIPDKATHIAKVTDNFVPQQDRNREATIRGAIESVLEQDYPYIEYIVVDGASKDNSLAVINEYKNGIDTIISEPDKGMYEAINKGIRAATGDIIGLIHSDDFLFSSHTISDIVKTFEEQDADMIYGNGIFVDYDDTNQMIRNWISGRYSKENVKNGWLPLHPTVYIKKECMDKWGLYDESYKIAADSDLLVRYLYEANLKVYYLNKYIVKMRMGGLSTDAGKSKLKWAEDLRMYKSHGIKPISALKGKILSKIPQFIEARLPWSEIPEAEEESLIQPAAANKKE